MKTPNHYSQFAIVVSMLLGFESGSIAQTSQGGGGAGSTTTGGTKTSGSQSQSSASQKSSVSQQRAGAKQDSNRPQQQPGSNQTPNSTQRQPGTSQNQNAPQQQSGANQNSNSSQQQPGMSQNRNAPQQQSGANQNSNSSQQQPGMSQNQNAAQQQFGANQNSNSPQQPPANQNPNNPQQQPGMSQNRNVPQQQSGAGQNPNTLNQQPGAGIAVVTNGQGGVSGPTFSGSIGAFSGNGFSLLATADGTPTNFTLGPDVAFVDSTGRNVPREQFTSATPAIVHYVQSGNERIAVRVVAQEPTPDFSAGTITEVNPGVLVIELPGASPTPVRYVDNKSTNYVDQEGNPVLASSIKSGTPVKVFYTKVGDTLIASKVEVVREGERPGLPKPLLEDEATTTTTTKIIPKP